MAHKCYQNWVFVVDGQCGVTILNHMEIFGIDTDPSWLVNPIGSMYGIYANIWGILMVNVTIYGIHGSYGNVVSSAPPSHFYGMDDHAANCVSEVLAARRMVGQELSPVACPKSWWILSLWMVKKSCTKGWLKAYK